VTRLNATIRLWEADSQLYCRWSGPDATEAHASFREYFARHGRRGWNRGKRAWSLPPTERRRLLDWAYGTFQRVGLEAPDAGTSGAGRCRGPPAAARTETQVGPVSVATARRPQSKTTSQRITPMTTVTSIRRPGRSYRARLEASIETLRSLAPRSEYFEDVAEVKEYDAHGHWRHFWGFYRCSLDGSGRPDIPRGDDPDRFGPMGACSKERDALWFAVTHNELRIAHLVRRPRVGEGGRLIAAHTRFSGGEAPPEGGRYGRYGHARRVSPVR
jgi:hypothetical protein